MVLSNEFYYERVQLDTINERFNKVPTAKEGDADGRGMIVVLTENGMVKNTTGVSLLFKWEHTSIAGAQGLENFEALDLTKGEYKVTYPAEMNHEGYVKAEVRIMDNGKYAGSRNMKIRVEPSVGDDTAIESSNQFSALVTALLEVNSWNTTIDGKIVDWEADMAETKQLYIDTMNDVEATYPQELLSLGSQLEQAATKAELSGVATPLVATLASQMTNVARVYVYKGAEGGYTNGNWYYHNGTVWVSGGVYQATGITDKSIDYNKTDFVKPNKNLYNLKTSLDGFFPYPTTGVLTAAPDHSCSDWIRVEPSTTYYNNYNSGYVCFSTIDKQFISGKYENSGQELATPANCYYMRLSAKPVANKATLQVELGTSFTSYESYSLFNSFYEIVNSGEHVGYHKAEKQLVIKGEYGKTKNIITDYVARNDYFFGITTRLEPHTSIEAFNTIKQLRLDFTSTGPFEGVKFKMKYNISANGHVAGDYIQYAFITSEVNFGNYSVSGLGLVNASGSATKDVFDLGNGYYMVSGYYQITATDIANNISIDELDFLSKTVGQVINMTILEPFVFVNGQLFDIAVLVKNALITKLKAKINTVVITSLWSGKKWATLGDSITQGNTWQPYVTGKLGLTLLNYGVGGTKITDTTGGDTTAMCRDERINLIDVTSDVISVMGGTNDYSQSVPLGVITDTVTNTFYGALNSLVSKLVTRFPTKPIFFMTPPWRDLPPSGGTGIKNLAGLSIYDYGTAIKEVCKLNGITVIDVASNAGWNGLNYTNYLTDGTHTNDAGGRRIASLVVYKFNEIEPVA